MDLIRITGGLPGEPEHATITYTRGPDETLAQFAARIAGIAERTDASTAIVGGLPKIPTEEQT